MLNVKEGFDRKDDQIPAKWFIPMKGEDGESPLMDYFETKRLTVEDLHKIKFTVEEVTHNLNTQITECLNQYSKI